jgi:hypothetical protein
VNKDGFDDILISDYGFYPSLYSTSILKGGSFPPDTIPDFGLYTQGQGLYKWVAQLGDVNGDGFNDFMSRNFSSPPAILLWVGGRRLHTTPDKKWYPTDPEGFCATYGAVGDINGDGLDDIAIGRKICSSPLYCEPRSWVQIFSGDSSVHADTTLLGLQQEIPTPSEYKLNDPFPNPFNPTITISWTAGSAGIIKIKLYDILGREIMKIYDKDTKAGENKIEFDAGKYGLTSGVYLIQMEVYDKGKIIYNQSKKISFLK